MICFSADFRFLGLFQFFLNQSLANSAAGFNEPSFTWKAVNAPPDSKKKALLQDTPTASVYTQLQKLTSQNPACKYIIYSAPSPNF